MKSNLDKYLDETARALRPPPRVVTNHVGQNIWMGEIKHLELELEPAENTDPYNSVRSACWW